MQRIPSAPSAPTTRGGRVHPRTRSRHRATRNLGIYRVMVWMGTGGMTPLHPATMSADEGEHRVESPLRQMTLGEKRGQMTQLDLAALEDRAICPGSALERCCAGATRIRLTIRPPLDEVRWSNASNGRYRVVCESRYCLVWTRCMAITTCRALSSFRIRLAWAPRGIRAWWRRPSG